MIAHAASWEAIRPRTNDERRGAWAARYYGAGHHRRCQTLHRDAGRGTGIPAHIIALACKIQARRARHPSPGIERPSPAAGQDQHDAGKSYAHRAAVLARPPRRVIRGTYDAASGIDLRSEAQAEREDAITTYAARRGE